MPLPTPTTAARQTVAVPTATATPIPMSEEVRLIVADNPLALGFTRKIVSAAT